MAHFPHSVLQQQHCGRCRRQQQWRCIRVASATDCCRLQLIPRHLHNFTPLSLCLVVFVLPSHFFIPLCSAALSPSESPLQPLLHFKQPTGDGQQVNSGNDV
jgi:hypothetical protein